MSSVEIELVVNAIRLEGVFWDKITMRVSHPREAHC